MTDSLELEDLVGETLMIGLSGPRATDEDLRTLAETRAAGVILYRRNFEDPGQFLRLLEALDAAAGKRLLVSTDHEGGRVVMLGQGTTIFPDNLAMGRGGDAADAARQGELEGRELRRLGVDLNLAPTLDVLLMERYSPNIGIRAYGEDPARVAELGVARIRAMQAQGVAACAKHFPGKGHSPLDAHLRLPVIESTEEDMRARHLPPFVAAIAGAGVECVMTSHPIYPHLDPERAPATFSRRIVTGLLREELGYGGVIVSDDLEMGAVSEVCPVGEAAVRAARAGHDLLLVCHEARAQRAAAAALVAAYRAGELPLAELEASAARVRALRERGPRARGGPPHPEPQGRALAASVARRAVRVVAEGKVGVVRPLEGRVAVVFPRFADLAARITIEPEVMDARAFVSHHFAGTRAVPDTVVVGVEPTAAEIERAAEHAAAAETTLLFLYDAHLHPTNRALLDALQARARSLAVVLLRDPWDAGLLAPGVTGVTAWGWRVVQLEACLERLLLGRGAS